MMKHKFKYCFSAGLAACIAVCAWVLSLFFVEGRGQGLLFSAAIFVAGALIIQYAFEKAIYRYIKKAYPYMKTGPEADSPQEVNIKSFAEDVKKYALSKKQEIELLKNRDSYRKEFIGNLSHEFKTPLFTVQGYVETLLDGALKDKTILEKYLKQTAKGVERLVYIINGLDMIAKLEHGKLKLNYDVFDLTILIKSVFELLEINASQKKITLAFDKRYEGVKVYADKESIQQVLTNLIVNSIKYGKERGTTEVSIEDVPSNKVCVKISDNGEGIEEKYHDRIFERFFRVERSRNRQDEGGSGLGLAIVRHLIEAHRQTVSVSSVFGVGTEVSFTLEKADPSKIIQKQLNQIIKSDPWDTKTNSNASRKTKPFPTS